ncbi:MAG: hypothetical protein LLG01_18985 [Planctomycetaceae bacterium]|nr:hypothetical protein [Planctomycetaceae bacterium]
MNYRLACLAAAALFAAAALADDLTPVQRLDQSKAAWAKLKADSGGNYEYEVHFQSWVGFGHKTTIVVKDNKVVERRFVKTHANRAKVMHIGPDGVPREDPDPPPEGWTETGDQIGKHGDGAAEPKTIDTLYDEASQVLQRKLGPDEKLYVDYYPNGVLRFCFWIDTHIADDTPRHGPKIDELRMSKPAASQPATNPRT